MGVDNKVKKKVILYGLGQFSEYYLKIIEEEWEIVAVSDGYKKFDTWRGHRFIEPLQINEYNYDFIVVPSTKYFSEISEYLNGIGVDAEKIINSVSKKNAEFAYWNHVIDNEKEFLNEHYKELMLCLAEEENDDFWKGKVIADFGCGPRGSLKWTNTPAIKIGIDVLIQEYMKITDLSKHGVIYVTAKEDKIPMPDECVDYIMALEVLDRVNDIEITLNEITRVLKTGGTFAGCFPLHETKDVGQPQSFNESIIELLTGDYEIISKRIAKRALSNGKHLDPYYNMINGNYVKTLQNDEQGFLWFRAIKKER